MTVYTGILGTVSGGNVYGDYRVRKFVNIGDHHIKNFGASEYLDEILLTQIGKEITVSGIVHKKSFLDYRRPEFALIAIKTQDGKVYRMEIGFIGPLMDAILNAILIPLLVGFVLAILIGIVLGFASLALGFASPPTIMTYSLYFILAGILIYLFVNPFIKFFKLLKAKREI